MRSALFTAILLVSACKKQPPAGDLPPAQPAATASQPAQPASPPASNPRADTPPNPHADTPPNPHGDTPPNPHGDTPPNPHAGMAAVPTQTSAKTLEKLADGRLALGPFSLVPPPKWTEKSVTSSMRAAQFVLPGGDAELIVYFFGDTGAGSVQDNLDRWLGQFQQPGGKPSRDVAKIETTKFGGQEATFVSVTGRFVADAMPGAGPAVDKADQALLAAIVASPAGPYYFKLVGAKATVDSNAAAFRALLGSLKLR